MSEYTPVERAVKILGRLALWHRVTVDDLYNYFDGKVSRRTLQRDLLRLSSADVPLISEPGTGRELVWSVEPRYLKFIPVQMGLDEFFAVEILRSAGHFFKGTPIQEDIEAAMEKMKQLVPEDVLATTRSLSESGAYLDVHKHGYVDYRQKGEYLQTFLWAAVRREICQVVYKRPGEEKEKTFTIHPYTLLHHRGAFYGIVYQPKHQNFIYLLIHRLQSIQPTGESFERDGSFNVDDFLKGTFGIWREDPVEVRIRFAPEVAATIRERIWHPSQKIEEGEDGDLTLTMTVAPNAELVAWILYWGPFARVLAPESLVESVLKALRESLRHYD